MIAIHAKYFKMSLKFNVNIDRVRSAHTVCFANSNDFALKKIAVTLKIENERNMAMITKPTNLRMFFLYY